MNLQGADLTISKEAIKEIFKKEEVFDKRLQEVLKDKKVVERLDWAMLKVSYLKEQIEGNVEQIQSIMDFDETEFKEKMVENIMLQSILEAFQPVMIVGVTREEGIKQVLTPDLAIRVIKSSILYAENIFNAYKDLSIKEEHWGI